MEELKEQAIEMGRASKKNNLMNDFKHPIRDSIYWVMCIPVAPEHEINIRMWFLMGYWGVSETVAFNWINRFKDRVIPDIFNKAILN